MRHSWRIGIFVFYAAVFSFFLGACKWAYFSKPNPPETIRTIDVDFRTESGTRTPVPELPVAKPVLPSAPAEPYTFTVRTDRKHALSLKKFFSEILSASSFKEKVTPISVELVDDRKEPRWRMTEGMVSMIVTLASDSESVKVFTHELGHVVDLQFLKKTLLKKDPSDHFYAISWNAPSEKKKGMDVDDFVSGYALSNEYEDFAETFAFYVFHNDVFRSRASENPILARKYDFFEKYVFSNADFLHTSFESGSIPKYLWDTTKIGINTKKYLFYLR